MKYNKTGLKRKRNYRKEYDAYYGKKSRPSTWTKKQKTRRKHKSSRNSARSKMRRKYKLNKNQDVDHRDGNPLNNKLSNLRVQHRSLNRSNHGRKYY